MTLLREIDPGLARQLHTPFDILVRNFFDTEAPFNPLTSVKLKHPVDVYEDKNGLHLEVACTGLTKKDVGLNIEGDVLRISYISSFFRKSNCNKTNNNKIKESHPKLVLLNPFYYIIPKKTRYEIKSTI